MIFTLSQETKHPDLKVFFNIQFDCTGNPNTDISVDSVAPTHSISGPTPITKKTTEKTNHYLLIKEAVKLYHLSTPFRVDF